MNRATFLLNMHQRSVAILEMIEKADMWAQEAARYIIAARVNKAPWHDVTIPIYERQLEQYVKISRRLQRWYADVQVRMLRPVIEKNNAKILGDIKVTEDHALIIHNQLS